MRILSEVEDEEILEVAALELPSLYLQLKALGIESTSEGTRVALAWRKFWLNVLVKEEIAVFANALKKKTPGAARTNGPVLLLGLHYQGRELKCVDCDAKYDPLDPTRDCLEADHIIPWSTSWDNSAENIAIRCNWHHMMQETGSAASSIHARERRILAHAGSAE